MFSPLDITEEINDVIIITTKINPYSPSICQMNVWVLTCTNLRNEIALKFAELTFALCECGPHHIYKGLGASWIAGTLMPVRQESQLDLKCFGILYAGPRQRQLQSNEMPVPTGMLLTREQTKEALTVGG